MLFCFLLNLVSAEIDPATVTEKVFLDINFGNEYQGKIVIGLFGATAPKTVRNFVALATHEVGMKQREQYSHTHVIYPAVWLWLQGQYIS